MTDVWEKFKEKLLVEKKLVEEELSTIAQRSNSNPADWQARPPEEGSVEFKDETADRLEELADREATTDVLETRLKNIDAALVRIANGNYGHCEIGQEIIEPERLEAMPTARTCKAHREEESRFN
ncbi:MAG: hypothetical protein AAB468_00880 [Patescibacteria group bacterium]